MRNIRLLRTLLPVLILGSQAVSIQAKPVVKPKAKPIPAKTAVKPSAAQERAVEKAFKVGVAFLEQEKYPQALAQFQKALKFSPNDPGILWNAATAAYSSQQYQLAATYFERDTKYEPLNGQLYARLVQTYQALGDFPRRDSRRATVFAMHRSGKDESGYTQKESYCRDQFTYKGYKVFAFESFELQPRSKEENLFAVRYDFLVAKPQDENPAMRLEVGWNSVEPDSKGGFKPGGDMSAFYFDAYYREGEYSRKTFGLYPRELPYDVVKQKLLEILNGKATMISGRKRSATGPGT